MNLRALVREAVRKEQESVREALDGLEQAILVTPTSPVRNILADANIHLALALRLLEHAEATLENQHQQEQGEQ